MFGQAVFHPGYILGGLSETLLCHVLPQNDFESDKRASFHPCRNGRNSRASSQRRTNRNPIHCFHFK